MMRNRGDIATAALQSVGYDVVCDPGACRYRLSTTISSRVGFLNPPWNVKNLDERVCSEAADRWIGRCLVCH